MVNNYLTNQNGGCEMLLPNLEIRFIACLQWLGKNHNWEQNFSCMSVYKNCCTLLIEAGFEYVTEIDDAELFKKRK